MRIRALRGVLILVAAVALPTAATDLGRAAHAQVKAPAEPPAVVSKKDQFLADKRAAAKTAPDVTARWHKQLDRQVGKAPKMPVSIYNKWTHEYLIFAHGDTQQPPADIANQFLRCHFTNQPTLMDQRLVSVLLQAAKKFNVRRVDVVSGFRDPKYNLTLRKKGRQVARNSEHTLGHAVDFRLPGINIKRLHAWARTLRLGGVGFYKSSRFIHVDVGRMRYWNGT